ncbi:MAG: DUF58 domain-containing protein [Archaeoglobales archaeon]|nr:DUF58 domain-containing protein [Archaeoglobales archaeon]
MKRILLSAVLVLLVQAYLLANIFPAILAFSILIYLAYIEAEFNPKIEAERILPKKLYDGEGSKAVLRIRNLRKKDFVVAVKERLPEGFKAEEPEFLLGKLEERGVDYSVIPSRGVYRIRGPEILVWDLRGLFFSKFQIGSEQEIEVLPSIEKLREEAKIDARLRLSQARGVIGFPVEFVALRRFQEGDDTRRIDWKATARFGELIVREYLKEWEGDVYVALDIGREMRKGKPSKIDYAVIVIYQIFRALAGKRAGLILYDEFGVRNFFRATLEKERLVEQIKVPRLGGIQSLRIPRIGTERPGFLRKIPRKGFSLSFLNLIQGKSFLIFITDLSTNVGELLRVISELKDCRAVIISPNPVLFSEPKLEREEILRLYRRYVEREEMVRRLNSFVPVIDVGPKDLLDEIEPVIG